MGNTTGRAFVVTTLVNLMAREWALAMAVRRYSHRYEPSSGGSRSKAARPSNLTTSRNETDIPEIVSGLHEGYHGHPITMLFQNADRQSQDYTATRSLFRPGHADFGYQARFGRRDHRGGGRASARETVARVGAAAIARQWLAQEYGINVIGWVQAIGSIAANVTPCSTSDQSWYDAPLRCPDPEAVAMIN